MKESGCPRSRRPGRPFDPFSKIACVSLCGSGEGPVPAPCPQPWPINCAVRRADTFREKPMTKPRPLQSWGLGLELLEKTNSPSLSRSPSASSVEDNRCLLAFILVTVRTENKVSRGASRPRTGMRVTQPSGHGFTPLGAATPETPSTKKSLLFLYVSLSWIFGFCTQYTLDQYIHL